MSAPHRMIFTRLLRIRPPFPRSHMSHSPRMPSRSSSTRPSFTYRLAASSAAKATAPRQPKLNQDYWLYASTQSNRSPPYLRSTKSESGEDAFFATTVGGSSHHVAFGVADGVGGWQDQGIDPSEFSHGLCGLMAGSANIWDDDKERRTCRPLGLLQLAYDAVIANPRIVAGGCTASLAVADKEGAMECANLGDSSFLHLAPRKIVHRSPIQTHAFNTPYQLSKIPARLATQEAIFGNRSHRFSELPSQADVTRHTLKHGDIVVFATDGVWDNLSPQDTLGIVGRVMMEGGYWFKSHNSAGAETLLNEQLIRALAEVVEENDAETYLPGLLARSIMREAKFAGLDRRRDGPFAKEVNSNFPDEGWEGGKPDDVAVVVCVAVEEVGEEEEKEQPMKAKL